MFLGAETTQQNKVSHVAKRFPPAERLHTTAAVVVATSEAAVAWVASSLTTHHHHCATLRTTVKQHEAP
jgi:hypothetical protein